MHSSQGVGGVAGDGAVRRVWNRSVGQLVGKGRKAKALVSWSGKAEAMNRLVGKGFGFVVFFVLP